MSWRRRLRGRRMTLTHFSLFSGIGGIDLAAEWAGFETVGQCEWADYPTKVLEKHWPNVPRWRDVKTVTAESIREQGVESITLLSGGFPCQPHSVAGKRLGTGDDRDLWGEFARIICEVRPQWILGENVLGLLTSESGQFFGRILRDLARMGYCVGWASYPASAVGAVFQRGRVFIIACADSDGLQRFIQRSRKTYQTHTIKRPPSENIRNVIGLWNGETRHSDRIRESNGVPHWMDRIKSLGNCVVPQQVYPILQAIADLEATT